MNLRIVPYIILFFGHELGLISLTLAIITAQLVSLFQLLFFSSKEVTFLTLLSSLAILQWLVGPLVYYSDLNPGQVLEITIMQVDSEEYFSYAWPGTLCLVIGLGIVKLKANIDSILLIGTKNSNWMINFIIVGIISSLILPIVPLSLNFIFRVISYLGFVGLFALISKRNKNKKEKNWILISSLLVIFNSFQQTMFGELIYFSLLTLLMLFYQRRISFKRKLLLFTVVGVFGIFIQLIKMPLRELNRNNSSSTISNISKLFNGKILTRSNFSSDPFIAYTIARFNNGAVISYVLDRVPKNVPYARGNTISSAILGSFIPRIIWPTKEGSGTEMYLKYTGLRFEGASYGISQLGEGYANFGKSGGIIYMFFLGLVMSTLLYKLIQYSIRHPRYFFFLPVIFLHGIKVETELNRSVGFMLRIIIALYILNLLIRLVSNQKYSIY